MKKIIIMVVLVVLSCTLYARNNILLYHECSVNMAKRHNGGINNREKIPCRRDVISISEDSHGFFVDSDIDKCQMSQVYFLSNGGQVLFSLGWYLADYLFVPTDILMRSEIIQVFINGKLYHGYVNN